MSFVYAFLIAGCVCALTQLLASLKMKFSLVALLLMVLGGGLCTKLGLVDWLNGLSGGGLGVTAVGCGNGAFTAGVALANTGAITPLLLTAALNIILVAMGAACGRLLRKRFPKVFAKKEGN